MKEIKDEWQDFRRKTFTPEEIAASDQRIQSIEFKLQNIDYENLISKPKLKVKKN
jgi:hypothetical protein